MFSFILHVIAISSLSMVVLALATRMFNLKLSYDNKTWVGHYVFCALLVLSTQVTSFPLTSAYWVVAVMTILTAVQLWGQYVMAEKLAVKQLQFELVSAPRGSIDTSKEALTARVQELIKLKFDSITLKQNFFEEKVVRAVTFGLVK